MNKQRVLVDFNVGGSFVYTIVSKNPITMDNVVDYFMETEAFDPDRDGITFLQDEPDTEINIDEVLAEQQRRAEKNGLYGGRVDDAN